MYKVINGRLHKVKSGQAIFSRTINQEPIKLVSESKGKKDGNCNRTACQAPGAHFFNTGTNAWYCAWCARDIHQFNVSSGDSKDFLLFPDFDKTWGAFNLLRRGEAESIADAREQMGLRA